MAQVGGLRPPRGTVPLRPLLVAARMLGVAEKMVPARLGLGFHPERVHKLFRSTNIVPERLTQAGFAMPGGLANGLERWYEAEPRGEFV